MSYDYAYLKNYDCLQDLDDSQLREIAQLSEAECFYPDHTLFEDGSPGTHIYLLAKGKLEILFAIGESGSVLVDHLSAGQVAGCPALVPPYTYRSTARSLTEIEVLKIDALGLRNLIEGDCALGIKVQQRIIQTLLDQIVDLQLSI
jgi:CRP-like cAMP-binding protein